MIDKLKQWVGVGAAAAIGLLVILLRMQGKRLHLAQVKLLEAKLDTKEKAAADDSAAALAKYDRAKEAYLKAGGAL